MPTTDESDRGDDVDGVAPVSPAPEPTQEDIVERSIDRIIATMSVRQKAGQLLMPGLSFDSVGRPILEMNDELERLLADVEPGGFILFAPNVGDPEQLRSLIDHMQARSPIPMIIGIDQEGGVVRRIVPTDSMPATAIPAARRVGRAGDVELAHELARVTARELRSLGITMNFAPVADVMTNASNPVIGSRSFGSDPDLVAAMVEATVTGYQEENVSAVIKHFPGHGDTDVDTHHGPAAVMHDLTRLRSVERGPFARGIEAGADGVMTGHVGFPAITGAMTPATMEPAILEAILRDELRYEGVVVTDSLVMGALTAQFGEREIPVRAAAAGADILLRPARPREALQALLDAIEAGRIPEERLDASVRRILRVKFRRGLMAPTAAIGAGGNDTSLWRSSSFGS
ncbi:MAG: glycoside hydrolase family 3 protein, partial [Spirochaetales bacterium]|nr:glycoside hydrolase family 3 protein [Spirochaetales bacterium]